MIIILIRTFILYLVVLFVVRVMGKAELSKLEPFQMVVLFMIAELAALPIESPDIPLITGISALIGLLFLQVGISYLSMKSDKLKRLFGGTPSILINRGQLDAKELGRLRITLSDLAEQLRLKNFPSISDVDYAVLETNGDLSVIGKPGKRPLTPDDMKMTKPEEMLPTILISDGHFLPENIERFGKDENYIKSELLKNGFHTASQIFLCFCDADGTLVFYEKNPQRQKKANDSTGNKGGSKK